MYISIQLSLIQYNSISTYFCMIYAAALPLAAPAQFPAGFCAAASAQLDPTPSRCIQYFKLGLIKCQHLLSTHTHEFIHCNAYVYIYIYIYIHTHMYVYVYVYMCIYIYIHRCM